MFEKRALLINDDRTCLPTSQLLASSANSRHLHSMPNPSCAIFAFLLQHASTLGLTAVLGLLLCLVQYLAPPCEHTHFHVYGSARQSPNHSDSGPNE
jgi:hypothetical protein